MRYSHESFRACLKQLSLHLDAEVVTARAQFVSEWKSFLQSVSIHMEMDDHDLFPLLDEVSQGEISKAGVSNLYPEDGQLLDAAQALLPREDAPDADWAAFKEAWLRWKTYHRTTSCKRRKR